MKICLYLFLVVAARPSEAWMQLQKPKMTRSILLFNRGSDNHDYTLSNDSGPNTSLLSDSEIQELLARRLKARLSRNYGVADSIRAELISAGVFVEDNVKEWRADGKTYDSRDASILQNFGPKGHDYCLYANSGVNTSKLSEQEIDKLIAERLKAKISRNYSVSTKIENELIDAGVYVNDHLREFRTDGTPFDDTIPKIKDAILPQIVNCNSLKQIVNVLGTKKNEMLPVHVSYCWNQCSRIVGNPRERRMLNYNPGLLYPLFKLTFSMAQRFDARCLAFTAHAVAKISSGTKMNVDPKLWSAIEDRAMELETFNEKAISNLLWAFSKVGYQAPKLFDKLASQAMPKLDSFPSLSISTMLWAYARQGHAAPALFDASSPIIINLFASSFNSRTAANVLWAYTKLELDAPELYDAIAHAALERLDTFNAQDISVLVLSFSRISHDEFFDAAADVLAKKIEFFAPYNVVNTLSAYAKRGQKVPKLLDAVAQSSLDLNKLKPHEISAVLFAYSKLGYNAPSLFDDIAEATIAKLDSFGAKDITSLLRSYAVLGHNCPNLFNAVIQKINDSAYNFMSEEKSNLIWAYEQLGYVAPQLWSTVLGGNSKSLLENRKNL